MEDQFAVERISRHHEAVRRRVQRVAALRDALLTAPPETLAAVEAIVWAEAKREPASASR